MAEQNGSATLVREATEGDLLRIAEIYKNCFPSEQRHRLWVESSYNSRPRGVYYVQSNNGNICGYILWCVKNGFRESTILELEQIGVDPAYAGKGFGKTLIAESLAKFVEHVESLGCNGGAIIVTTNASNHARKIYETTLDVREVARISGYGSGDEIILFRKLKPT